MTIHKHKFKKYCDIKAPECEYNRNTYKACPKHGVEIFTQAQESNLDTENQTF